MSTVFAPDLSLGSIPRHLDISRDRLSSYYKFKLTRKVLSLFVQKLVNLMSLDISGHMILENCSISKMDEEAGQTRYGGGPLATWIKNPVGVFWVSLSLGGRKYHPLPALSLFPGRTVVSELTGQQDYGEGALELIGA